MNMIEAKTAELSGKALDWAVAQIESETEHVQFSALPSSQHYYAPSRKWAQGGPLIERERIGVWANSTGYFAEKRHFGRHHKAGRNYGEGSTPLIAAMRCLVAANLGDVVSVPEELAQQPTKGSSDE